MLRQSPSWNQRAANGFKVKHALQVFLLLAICTWVLYQVRHKEGQHKDVAGDEFQDKGNEGERMKFGRKELRLRPEKEDFEEMEVEGQGIGDDEMESNDEEIAEEADAADESGEDFGDKEDKETEDRDESSAAETGRSEAEEKEDQEDGILKDRRKETSHLMQVLTLVHENARVYRRD